jgi:glycosyltransferase involved in cell wall biosynthesis
MLHWKGRLRSQLQSWLKVAGKGDKKVAGVFGASAADSHRAVVYLREGAPEVPIWLFTTVEPLPQTEALCERVFRNENTLSLAAEAQSHLWKCWVAISVGAWTGERGAWPLKLAPFLIPPFRVLILNRDGGFFSGTPSNIFIHCVRAARDAMELAWADTREAIHSAHVRTRDALDSARVRCRDIYRGLSKLAAATGLRVLATLLRWMLNPHIWLFRHLHGNQPLMLDAGEADGEGVVPFRQTGPQWNGEALEKLARSSDARWVLWQSGSDSDSVPEGTLLFDDARTFAVSRQAHFRGWKKQLAATAPFRALQHGEATRVLAPLSGTILVDRKKLLALGIPRCSMPGTAWLILFWKAAAAGWRSYSVGSSLPLKEQPEFPIQDTEFVLKALGDPSLRRLCPRQEDLSRGNVCFALRFDPLGLETSSRVSERLKVLVVSPFLPFPLSHGGAVRIYNLCQELSRRVDFTLIAMREANEVVDYARLHQVFREVHVVDKDERTADHKTLPAQVSASESASLRALIAQLSRKLMPDLIQFEFTHFAGFRECAPGVPAILVEHDLTFSLYRQLAEANSSPASWREYERWLQFERKWLAAYEGVWTVSEQDRARAIEEGKRSGERTFAIANGVDIDRFRPSELSAGSPEVFYVGSFRHLPNIIGFENLCQEIMPRVWARTPDARLRVVAGPDYESFWKRFGRKQDLSSLDPRIEIHGFVEDLRPLYARASVVAVPLEVSAGTNIKVLEAMACGKAIVSTPVGCAGLGLNDEYHVAIRQDWGEFSDALCDLLSAPAARLSMGARARRAAENYFSWAAIAERAYESYQAVAGRTSPTLQRKDRSMSVA